MSLKPELTLHKLSHSTEGHFYDAKAYNTDVIEAIEDHAEGDTEKAPTSIPSPFARFSLFKAAFRNLCLSRSLRGTPNDERLVSACFDVGEIFFNYDKFKAPKGPLQLLTWDRQQALQQLKGGSKGHQRLGRALELYLREDAGSFNFDEMRRLYLLYYESPQGVGFIGGTSPATLFFASPNDLRFVDITFGNHRVFDAEHPVPLHERDVDYQLFWHGLRKFMPGFGERFPEVADYLRNSLELLHQRSFSDWQRIGANGENLSREAWDAAFPELEFGDNQFIEFLGNDTRAFRMRKVASGPDVVENLSHFLLYSERYTARPMPMVLSSDFFDPIPYTRVTWRDSIAVPHHLEADWRSNQRQLPGQADFYPYLVNGDFFEPHLIRLVYPINDAAFFDGNLAAASKSYLLPLKPDFFEFFSAEELMAGGEVKFQLEERAGGAVRATLTLPLARREGGQLVRTGRSMKLSRMYYNDADKQPDLARNEGTITEHQFGLTIFPFVRIKNAPAGFRPMYRVHTVDRDVAAGTYRNQLRLSFSGENNNPVTLPDNKIRQRSRKALNTGAASAVYVTEADFERITVEIAGHRGVLLPRFPEREMQDLTFTFAVDFGTTNTHIEYKTSEDPQPRPFTFDTADAPLASLHHPTRSTEALNAVRANDLEQKVPLEFLPERIGPSHLSQFPQRTALVESHPNFSGETLFGLGDFNIGFLYEKSEFPNGEYTISTNLKWSDFSKNPKAQKRIEGFLQSLLLLMRAKVLLNGGDLSQTRLMWFYPLSMVEHQRNFFEGIWNRLYADIISTDRRPRKVPESIAPFYWYKNTPDGSAIFSSVYPAALIDIGGGTSDMVVFEKDEPTLLTSVRFAANAVFGDGFSADGAAGRNGFIKKYDQVITDLLRDNNTSLLKTYESIKAKNRSEDIVAFYFSLKNNRELRKKADFDFNEKLSHDAGLKVVFVVFYASLIYHLAKVMKAHGKAMPRYIAFSGTGSKVLGVLTANENTLSQLAVLLFEHVYGQPYPAYGLGVVREQAAPKEATSRGGLKMPIAFDRSDDGRLDTRMDEIKTVLWGTTDDRPVQQGDTYQKIDAAVLADVGQEVQKFLDLLFGLEFGFGSRFGVKDGHWNDYHQILKRNLIEHVHEGWNVRERDLDTKNGTIEETLFFYPLVGALNQLAYEAGQMS